jgi:hypothetical protein
MRSWCDVVWGAQQYPFHGDCTEQDPAHYCKLLSKRQSQVAHLVLASIGRSRTI